MESRSHITLRCYPRIDKNKVNPLTDRQAGKQPNMPNKNGIGLPEYIAPLLQPTPTGAAKLVAAWDGLDTESQILILTELDKARLPAYLNEKIRMKALDSANAYVRYLAARGLHFSHDDSEERKAIRQRIEEDPDPLVRYCLMESEWNLLHSPDLKEAAAFFALPHEARLAKVLLLKDSGKAMAILIAYASDHLLKEGKISEIEIFEILSDYLNKPSFREHYNSNRKLSYDGFGEYLAGEDIEALWGLILKLPESISHILIEKLPSGVGLSSGIPNDILKGMTDWQLARLFNREDIDLRDFRKKVFFDADEKRDYVKRAAIRYNFDLEYAEFATVLAKPEKEKVKILGDFTTGVRDLSLCFYEAIHDVLSISDVDLFSRQDAEFARDTLKRKLKELKGEHRERQLRELRLYRLAKQSVPWKKRKKNKEGYLPTEELEFLSKSVVEGDTWGTFMLFSRAWAEDSWRAKKLEKHLPSINEASEVVEALAASDVALDTMKADIAAIRGELVVLKWMGGCGFVLLLVLLMRVQGVNVLAFFLIVAIGWVITQWIDRDL